MNRGSCNGRCRSWWSWQHDWAVFLQGSGKWPLPCQSGMVYNNGCLYMSRNNVVCRSVCCSSPGGKAALESLTCSWVDISSLTTETQKWGLIRECCEWPELKRPMETHLWTSVEDRLAGSDHTQAHLHLQDTGRVVVGHPYGYTRPTGTRASTPLWALVYTVWNGSCLVSRVSSQCLVTFGSWQPKNNSIKHTHQFFQNVIDNIEMVRYWLTFQFSQITLILSEKYIMFPNVIQS